MNIAMTGATGYIGKHLSNYLTEKGGHRIIPLGRAMFREGMSGLLVQTLTHCDVIINLAGAPINQRWTPEHKQELFNSRITVTHRIIRALNAVKTKPKPSAAGSVERGDAAEWTRPAACGKCGKTLKMVKIEGFWTLRRESRIKGWRRNRRFSCSQQPAVRTVSRDCAGAAIGACLEKNKRGWHQKSHKCRRFKGFWRAAPQIGGL